MTDVLKLNLQHCYGIGKLEAELEFTHKGFAIYAPNGVMKTSFARTMMNLSKGESPSDLAFPGRNSTFEVSLNSKSPLRLDHRACAGISLFSSGQSYPACRPGGGPCMAAS